ncbi:MAG: hypothetical protein IPM82_21705 [Saprospiraceae bacterium]|nr:hypothetical protein [Saprospiraceae bacterium]
MADTTWQRVWKESEVEGAIISKIESIFLKTTDFSPNNFTANPGWRLGISHLPLHRTTWKTCWLVSRGFTVQRFERYGMTNKIYWTPTDADQGADNMLYYFLTHLQSSQGHLRPFPKRPEWITRKASEVKGAAR